ncbi:uncharacterized protein LOC144745215 [Ciona intestinalis]
MMPLDTLHELMNIPLFKWLEPVLVKPKPLSQTQQTNMDKITEQYRIARTLLQTQKTPMMKLKVLGVDTDLSSIADIPQVEKLSIKQLLRLFEKLESGMDINQMLMGNPLHFESAIPTSIGIPVITNIDVSILAHITADVMVEIKKLYYTGRGSVKSNLLSPMVHTRISLERRVEFPRSTSCGSALHLKLFSNTTFVGLSEINFKPREIRIKNTFPKTIVKARVFPFLSKWATNVTDRNTRRCVYSTIFNDFGVYARRCSKSLLNIEYLFKSNSLRKQDMTIKWGPMMAEVNNQLLPSMGVHVTENRPLSTLSLNYIPALHEVRFEKKSGTDKVWLINCNLLVNMNSRTAKLESLFTSCNRTTGMVPTTQLTLFFKRTEEQETFQQVMAQDGGHAGRLPAFDVEGVFRSYDTVKMTMIGHIPKVNEFNDYRSVFNMYPGVYHRESSPLFTVIWSAKNIIENGDTGRNFNITIKNTENDMF